MYTIVAVVTALALAGARAEDRTLSGVASGLTHLLSPSVQGVYPPAAPEYSSYWESPHNQGFTVQTGYEGVIAPTGPAPDAHSTLQKLGGVALGAGLLTHLLPFPFNKIVLFLGTKLGLWALGFLLFVLVGGAATTALCAFTPICTISFLGFKFNRESVRALLSQDHLNMATQLVHDAIDKYKKLQSREGKAFSKSKKSKPSKENKEAKEERNAKELTETEENAVAREGREEKPVEEVEPVKEIKEVETEKKDEINEVSKVKESEEPSRESSSENQ